MYAFEPEIVVTVLAAQAIRQAQRPAGERGDKPKAQRPQRLRPAPAAAAGVSSSMDPLPRQEIRTGAAVRLTPQRTHAALALGTATRADVLAQRRSSGPR